MQQELGKEESQKEGWSLRSSSSADYASDNTLQTRHSNWLSAYQANKGSRRGLLWQLVVLRALITKRLRLLYRGEPADYRFPREKGLAALLLLCL